MGDRDGEWSVGRRETAREREGDAQTQVGVTQSQADDAQGGGRRARQADAGSAPRSVSRTTTSTTAWRVTRAIHEHFGTECTIDQLAGAMDSTAKSGTFRLRVSTARIFGFVTTSRGGVALTDLGQAIVDETREKDARARAFLQVPLYHAIHEKYRGNILPPTAALESEMTSLGVATKQSDKARQAFDRSAQQAGFYEHGRNRLILPGRSWCSSGSSTAAWSLGRRRSTPRRHGKRWRWPSNDASPVYRGTPTDASRAEDRLACTRASDMA